MKKIELIAQAEAQNIRFKKSWSKAQIEEAITKRITNDDPYWKTCKDTGIRFDCVAENCGFSQQLHPVIADWKQTANINGWYSDYFAIVEYAQKANITNLEEICNMLFKANQGEYWQENKNNLVDVLVLVGRANEIKPVGNTVVTNCRPGWSSGYLRLFTQGEKVGETNSNFVYKDNSRLSRSGKGDVIYFDLADGIYEADSVARSYESVRVWFKFDQGNVIYFENKEKAIADLWSVTVEELRQIEHQRQNEALQVELVDLTVGSIKQVNWAKSLRYSFILHLRKLQKQLPAKFNQQIELLIPILANINLAKFWIETRNIANSNHNFEIELQQILHCYKECGLDMTDDLKLLSKCHEI